MKFALFILASWPQGGPQEQSRVFAETLEQIEYAEELGFDAVWLSEHHFSRYGICPSTIPFATHIAARTKKIRIGTGVSVLTFHNPIFLAEESAMLDILSGGRLDFGVGRGQLHYEYGNFGVDYDSRTQRFQEVLDIILGLWTTPGFTYTGEYYQVKDLTVAPSPVQQPHPPLYLAVSRSAASVDVAVTRDLPVLTGANTTDEDSLGIRHLYYQRCADLGKTPLVDQMPYFRVVYTAEDQKRAPRRCAGHASRLMPLPYRPPGRRAAPPCATGRIPGSVPGHPPGPLPPWSCRARSRRRDCRIRGCWFRCAIPAPRSCSTGSSRAWRSRISP